MKLSLVIPAYNEAKRLGPFLRSIASYYQRHRSEMHEIIVVDDGSRDRTSELAQTFSKRLPLRVMTLKTNQGKGAAIKAGVASARGDVIVFMDADGATDIAELPKMITALQQADIAIGNRWMQGAHTQRSSLLRRLAGWTYRTYLRLFGLGKIDTMCGFKGYRRAAAQQLFRDLKERRWLFDTEIAYRAVRRGLTIQNFPIRWQSKEGSKLSALTLLKSAVRIWPLIRRVQREGTAA